MKNNLDIKIKRELVDLFKILDHFFGDSNINIIRDLNKINSKTLQIMPKTPDSILSKL